jgi:hypothetical protein
MLILLLVLVLLLVSSSSLLASSSAGGEDMGGDSSQPEIGLNLGGEIAGSVSVSSDGELWLTTFIDEFSILARVDIVQDGKVALKYRLCVTAVDSPSGDFGEISSSLKPYFAQGKHITEFNSELDAANKIIKLFDDLGIALSKESLKSIPFAISCGWREPNECKRFIDSLLKEKDQEDS